MTAVLAIAVLGVLCAVFAALLAYREREHDRERAALLDRIQAPTAVQAAAAMRLVPPPPSERPPEPDVFVPPTDPDLLLDRQLEPI